LLRSILLLKPVSDFANSIHYYSNPALSETVLQVAQLDDQALGDRRKPHQRVQLAESVVSDIALGKPLTQAFRGKPITVESLWEGFCELEEPQKQQFKRLMLVQTTYLL